MKVPIKLWMLLMPLEDVERQQIVDAVVKALPGEKQELERAHLLSGLPAKPTFVNGRPGSVRLVDMDGTTIYHSYTDSARITLFEFAAPAIPGCQVTLESTTSQRASAQWSIGFKGASGSRRTEVRTTSGAVFSVDAGQRKRVFVDVPVEISRVFEIRDSILRPTDLIYVTALSKRPTTIPFPPGIELIRASQSQRAFGPADLVSRGARFLETFSVAGDPTGAPAIYTREFDHSQEVSPALRANVKGVDVGVTASVGVTAGLKLKYALVGGHDYQLYATEDGLGITWIVT
jgi:hypothetical protein